ncbi:ABC transporter permease [Fulvivirga lutea]|uniref:ABC transporter permease n=1 Tax=Fulvivirga lutea TaxID=2810512 RepID=A0A975A0M3_9BACT|nr:ABC transporter permease [Fulvivirga lutea]QSE97345.1 ABC transporter permease [Fulvivirga lutea]
MHQPPKFIQSLLAKICPEYLWEGIAGDLEEQFYYDIEELGYKRAKQNYFWNAVKFIRPEILLRNKFKLKINNTIMITNYIKIAGRHMARRKLFTFINAFGLSIGLAFALLIYLYIQDEHSFDKFHANAERIYRVEEYAYRAWDPDPENPYIQSPWLQTPFAPTVKEELAEVEFAARFDTGEEYVVKSGKKIFTEPITFTDPDFFKMFSFPIVSGNQNEFLKEKHHAIITEAMAKKYFNDVDPLGATLLIDIDGEKEFEVVGVMQNPPANSSLYFDILVNQTHRFNYERSLANWSSFNTPTFVQLRKGADYAQFFDNLQGIRDKYMSERLARSKERYSIPDDVTQFEYHTTRLDNIHLNNNMYWHKVSDPQYSYILGALALLITIIAAINYISLALTTSTLRSTEVGVRKSIGASKNQLISQFAVESVVLVFVSLILGVLLMYLFLPTFNDFTGKAIELNFLNLLEIAGFAVLISLAIGLLAGAYPAFFLSSFSPTRVLKGGASTKVRAGIARPLVLLQFTLSTTLIISAFVMYQQMKYITTKDLGFKKDQVLVVPIQLGWTEEANLAVERVRNNLQNEPDIVSVAGTTSSFNRGWSRYGYEINGENKKAYVWAVDPSYINAMGIELLEGRNFSASIPSDTTALIVNEALVKDMGWDTPLDEYLNWREDTASLGYKVIGVVKDYHFRSLESEIEPMFLSMDKYEIGYYTTLLIKLKAGSLPGALDKVEEAFNESIPDKPFEYTFLDEDIQSQYASFERWMNIMGLATIFALLISGLGLFGLAGINVVNRMKEIGIRKVFGAPVSSIFILVNKQFVLMALIAFIIAAPLASYLMNNWWLGDFQFKIEMGWPIYVVSFLIGLTVALLTVTYHGIRAARLNPTSTLRYE